MQIKIKRRSQAEWLTLFIFVMPFFFFFLMDILRFPSVMKYTIDVAWISLLVIMLFSRAKFATLQVKRIIRVVLMFFGLTLMRYVLTYQSVLYYLWGLRNYARFFVFFAACILFLKRESAETGLKLIDRLFWVNLVVTLYQFFLIGGHQDRLGGIFGTSRGCNAYTNIFLLIVVTWYVLRYMNYQADLWGCIIKCLLSAIIAALAELKFFFLEFILIVALATMVTKFSPRNLWIVIGAIVGLYIGLEILNALFPSFSDWFTLEKILELAGSEKGYTSSNDMNRLTAIGISWTQFLETWPQKLFGLGLGNCDYATGFEFLTTPFFRRYGSVNYNWFSTAFMILENGLVGLILYMYFFVQVYISARAVEKRGGDAISCQMAKIMVVISLLLIVYNGSMRTEAAYMIYFVLALPFMQGARTESEIALSNAGQNYNRHSNIEQFDIDHPKEVTT